MIADNILIEKDLAEIEELDVFKSVFYASIQNSLPVAIWQMPNQKNKTIITDLSGKTKKLQGEIESLNPGFILSPFDNEKEFNFIKADVIYKSGDTELKSTSFNSNSEISSEIQKQFFTTFNELISHKTNFSLPKIEEKKVYISEKERYLDLVQRSVQKIKDGTFNKVVISRSKKIELPENFNLIDAFEFLCNSYPTAFVSLNYTPEYGIWIGATPETLISVDENNQFKTIALAGTQAKDKYETIAEAAWTQKEIEEQALVSRYIINCFKKIRLREFEEFGPRSVAAGSLLHLCTDFLVDMDEVNFNDLGTVMLSLLHPTSAVCGMPKEASKAFIKEYEGYNRELYSGYLGPVNIEDRIDVFVNLRCMQILNNSAVFYAGGGITRDSVPEKEWKETEMKMGVMGKLFE